MAEPTQRRLDDLEEQIDDARRDAEEHGILPDTTEEPTFRDPNPDEPADSEGIGDDEAQPPG